MIHQRTKDLYAAVLGPLTRLNYWRVRLFGLPAGKRPTYLNLGCGAKYAPGFVNIDINLLRARDVLLDIRRGLPWRDRSVDGIYCSHVVEHFYPDELRLVLSECCRVLRNGAAARFVVPSLEKAVAAYVSRQASWLPECPEPSESVGGRLSNLLFCSGQHKLALDAEFFDELLRKAGFSRTTLAVPGKSGFFPPSILRRAENVDEPHIPKSLIVEAWKERAPRAPRRAGRSTPSRGR